jgi:hypothetical protein
MHGPICIFWANLTPFSLKLLLIKLGGRYELFHMDAEVGIGLGSIVALYYNPSTLHQICYHIPYLYF